jgi:alanine racemase
MVRPGILLYGYNPVKAAASVPPFPVEKVMELRSRVVFIRKLRRGESLSYGRTWQAPQDTCIATLPLGYADGLNRRLGGNWSVCIRDRQYPLVGRICMDQCFVDLGPDTSIERWEEAVIFGGPASGADLMAEKIGTIPYELTCNISRRVPRVYVE